LFFVSEREREREQLLSIQQKDERTKEFKNRRKFKIITPMNNTSEGTRIE
jgi:hypothetical protein